MTDFAIERTEAGVLVGTRPPHPEQTALVEARGALLLWDALDRRAHPAAEIHDLDLAADWLWEVYGPEASNAILAGADRVAAEGDSAVLAAARALAHLHWAEAWWPSSHEAAVPALPLGLLRAEAAQRTAGIEHLLDDEEAIERALADVDPTEVAAFEADPVLGSEVRALAAGIAELAEDCGVALRAEPARFAPQDWALAAGEQRPDDLEVANGSAPVDWAFVPQGLVDASGEATWTLAHRSGVSMLTVAVPGAPDARDTALVAAIGTATIDLQRDEQTGMFTGEVETPQGFLMLPAADRVLRVHAPAFATASAATDPDAAARRTAIIEFARERLTAPDATLTERAAARETGAA